MVRYTLPPIFIMNFSQILNFSFYLLGFFCASKKSYPFFTINNKDLAQEPKNKERELTRITWLLFKITESLRDFIGYNLSHVLFPNTFRHCDEYWLPYLLALDLIICKESWRSLYKCVSYKLLKFWTFMDARTLAKWVCFTRGVANGLELSYTISEIQSEWLLM